MNKERFEKRYNVECGKLTFEPHDSGLYEVATVGDYDVYHELRTDEYEVVHDNQVLHWRVNLSAALCQI